MGRQPQPKKPALSSTTFAGPQEFADELGVRLGTIRQWRRRGILPEPDLTRSGVPFWSLRTIFTWMTETGRGL